MNAYFYELEKGNMNSIVGIGICEGKLDVFPYAIVTAEGKPVAAVPDIETGNRLLTNALYGACATIALAKPSNLILKCGENRTFETLEEVEAFVEGGYKETPEYKIYEIQDAMSMTIDIESASLDEYKAYRQEENKNALAKYLKDNPIRWLDGRYYGVTQEDQIEMQTDMNAYTLKQQTGDTNWRLEWHDVKKSCREFTLEEFSGLMSAIIDYVYPLRRRQEQYKELIYACESKEDLYDLEFIYAEESEPEEPVDDRPVIEEPVTDETTIDEPTYEDSNENTSEEDTTNNDSEFTEIEDSENPFEEANVSENAE